MGVLGVGFPAEETTDDPSPGSLIDKEHYQYDNFPIALKRVILFGGVDHSKYQGTLWTVPMVNNLLTLNQTTTSRPEITLNGLGFRDDKKNVTLWGEKIPVLLDTGTTLAYAPKQVVDVIAKRVNGTIDSKTGGIKLKKCPNAKDNSELIFNFAGADPCFLVEHGREAYGSFLAVANGNDSAPLQIEAIISDVPSAVKAPQYYNTFASSNLPSTVTNDIFASTATASMEPPSSVLESLKSKSSSTSSIDTSVPSDDKKIIDDDHSGHDHAKRCLQ
ncbi:Peptidase family A1 domain profile [Nakaseomyces glabratus]|nr:Peptidase family A1 domain profile [Nakaseomyces glabratus]